MPDAEWHAAVNIGRGLLVMLIWLLVLGIFWVPVLLVGWWLVRRRRFMVQM